MQKCHHFIGVILAGGKSSRMQQDKALLPFGKGNLLEHQQQLFRDAHCTDVVISRNDHNSAYIKDIYPNAGPMSAIYSAMMYCHTKYEGLPLVITPVDMPLLTTELVSKLACAGFTMQSCLHFEQHPFPLYLPNTTDNRHYAKLIASDENDRSIMRYLNIIASAKIKTEHHAQLINTNTPEQWQQAMQSLAATEN